MIAQSDIRIDMSPAVVETYNWAAVWQAFPLEFEAPAETNSPNVRFVKSLTLPKNHSKSAPRSSEQDCLA
jgi:hypothetical protein